MDLVADVATSGLLPLERYAHVMGRTFPDVLRRAGRGVVRRVVAITPPASAHGIEGGLGTASEARAKGDRAVVRDLNRVFVPVRLKGRRRERISAQEMVAIHRKHLGYKRPGRPMRRYGGPYYVDVRKFNALAATLRSHVGRLAAGWYPAAAALDVSTPAWVSRHGLGRGTYQADFSGQLLYIKAVNHASIHAPTEELRRRVPYALRYQAAAMNREMQHLLLRHARATGFHAAAG